MSHNSPSASPQNSEQEKKRPALPPHVACSEPAEERSHLRPVAWLLGQQLIASLKGTLLYTAFGSKLDARDWMHPEPYPAADQAQADNKWQELADKSWKEKSGTEYWETKGEFWFDYIADTGDGTRATYSIAYLCFSRLWAEGALADLQQNFPALPDKVGFMLDEGFAPVKPVKYADRNLNRHQKQIDPEKQTELPRGEFLLVGGDTTYHLSDYEGLHTRFQTPFCWAFKDAVEDGRLWIRSSDESWNDLRRPLFGIPGNHDYYDQLDGFRRQFRNPVKEDRDIDPKDSQLETPQLMLPGFTRYQQASYVALSLPFNWRLWGLDTEIGKIDERQRNFFLKTVTVKNEHGIEEVKIPDKLIVATCAPTTVFGKYAYKDDEKSAKAFYQLGLSRPFLNPEEEHEKDEKTELEQKQCRLDLSGDVHHYARYWGRDNDRNPRGAGGKEKKKADDHYASVVSGLGGAFHHPSTTYAGQISEQVLYPSVKVSREEVARRIFKPWNIIRGGGVWVIGFLLTFLIYFSATIADSSRQAINNLPPLVWAGVTKATAIRSTVSKVSPEGVDRYWINPWYHIYGKRWTHPPTSTGNHFIHFWGEGSIEAPPDYWMGSFFSVLSLALIFLAFWPTERLYKKYRKHEEVRIEAISPTEGGVAEGRAEARTNLKSDKWWLSPIEIYYIVRGQFNESDQTTKWYETLMVQFNFWVWPVVALSALALGIGMLTLLAFRDFLTPFGNSLMVLLTLLWATVAIILSVRYSDWLSRMASKITIKFRHWLLVWFMSIVAVLAVFCGLYIFGHNNTASDMLVDILITLVTAAVLVGLTYLGASKLKEVRVGSARKSYAALGVAFGLFHALLHILVPFLLVRKGTWQAWVMAVFVLLLMQVIGWWLMKENHRGGLLVAWIVFGLIMLTLPYIAFYLFHDHDELWSPFFNSFSDASSFNLFGPTRDNFWLQLLACIIAGLVGLVMSCIWLNWYLAVSLLYHGHNNEAGGAARIEKFKQFIRFRLTDNDLTGFVIAVDEPKEHGYELRPKLIDVIYLTRKP